jgi:hypothetical protein
VREQDKSLAVIASTSKILHEYFLLTVPVSFFAGPSVACHANTSWMPYVG